jgi:hypothetical protein
MIVVKVELWPRGDSSNAKLLGISTIANDGTGTISHGYYDSYLFKPEGLSFLEKWVGWKQNLLSARHGKKGRVEEFPRTNHHYSVWDLVFRSLLEMRGQRNSTYIKSWFKRKVYV